MMGRVSRPAQIVAVLVLGIGGAIYYVQREAAGVPSRAGTPNVESRALHEATSDEDLRKEQSRLHEAIAREVAVVADEYVVRGEHVPSHADAPRSAWGKGEVTVRMEAEGKPVLVVLKRSDAPDVFRLYDKHGWITSILDSRAAATE